MTSHENALYKDCVVDIGTPDFGDPHRQIYIDLGIPSPNLHRYGDPVPISMIDMGTPHPNIHGRYGDPYLYAFFCCYAMALAVLNCIIYVTHNHKH